MKWVNILMLTGLMVVAVTHGAAAHRYIPNDGTHTDAANAIDIGDIEISQVVYHTVTVDRPTVWLQFEAEADAVAKIQLGVPHIAGLETYRPAFALLGPDLPPLDNVPFDVPEGYGGILYTTDDIAAPDVFNEEFTGTKSWVFEMQHIELPADGLYYIVGFVPSGRAGKFWLAPGTIEQFGVMDIVTLPRVIYNVRTFHQVFPFGGLLAWGMVILTALVGFVASLFF